MSESDGYGFVSRSAQGVGKSGSTLLLSSFYLWEDGELLDASVTQGHMGEFGGGKAPFEDRGQTA